MELLAKRETLTVNEVARVLGISASTVYRSLWSGEIPSFRIRGRWLVPRQGIAALLKAGASLTSADVHEEFRNREPRQGSSTASDH